MSRVLFIAFLLLVPELGWAQGGIYGHWLTDEFGLPAFE